MACRHCLGDQMVEQQLVEVSNPGRAHIAPWVGRVLGICDHPTFVLEQLDGSRVTLPQTFKVVDIPAADPVVAARARVARAERDLAEAHHLLSEVSR